jgi:leucyl/phenylalanyl-tRNA--protein transferase
VFFGESMFSVARDASKVALHALVQASLARNVRLIDCQVDSEHMRSLGARSVPRREFVRELAAATGDAQPGAPWRKA